MPQAGYILYTCTVQKSLNFRKEKFLSKIMAMPLVVSDTANLALCLIAECCHLANLIA